MTGHGLLAANVLQNCAWTRPISRKPTTNHAKTAMHRRFFGYCDAFTLRSSFLTSGTAYQAQNPGFPHESIVLVSTLAACGLARPIRRTSHGLLGAKCPAYQAHWFGLSGAQMPQFLCSFNGMLSS